MANRETAIEGAVQRIEEQKKALYSFVEGRCILFPCRQGMASPFVSLCYHWFLTVWEMLGRLFVYFAIDGWLG